MFAPLSNRLLTLKNLQTMKKITLLTFLLISTFTFGQKIVDLSDVLANVNGHVTIDGNMLQAKYNTKDQIIVVGEDMVIQDRSSFVFNNVIIQLSGNVVVKGDVRPKLIDSYIFCKNSDGLKSKNIIESNDYSDVVVGEVDYIKKLPAGSEIWLYNAEGKRIFKGKKEETHGFSVPVSRYDVKVVGHSFQEKMLFAHN